MSIISNYINRKINEYIIKEISDTDPSAVIVSDEEYKKLENRVWYNATSGADLEQFYKTTTPRSGVFASKNFYNKVNGKMPRVHVPVAKLLTNTIVNLIFSEKPGISVDTGNKKTSVVFTEDINDTLDENGGEQFLKDAAGMVSYSGGVAIKFILDPNFSDKVIFQPYPAESFIIKKKYGRLQEIVFKDFYDDDYQLLSHYGIGYIHYELIHKGDPAKLEELPDTADLRDVEFFYNDGTPVKCCMAAYMDNTTGTSDYAGCVDNFALLDELKSTMLYIERSTKPKKGIPSGLCEVDTETGKAVLPDSWDIDSTLLEVQDPEQKIKNMNELTYASPNLDSCKQLYKDTLKEICICSGLSPNTMGIEDTSGANASAEALNIREHSSLRKRATLILCYTKFLKELCSLILSYNNALANDSRIVFNNVYRDYDYSIDFSEYNNPSFDNMVEVLSNALEAGLISKEYALHELYDNSLTENQIEEMKLQIANEKSGNIIKPEEESEEDTEENDKKEEEQ